MIQEDLDTWEQFENRIQLLQNPLTENGEVGNEPHLLFRGQADQSWGLETTLDRANKGEWSFSEYFRLILVAKTQVETFTDNRWEIEELPQLRKWAFEYGNLISSPFPAYDFLVFLRHHGFPSPLLDWTRSPYVAAFFAFAQTKAERVAVYVYQEHAGYGKLSSSNEPLICSFGPNVRSHSRHFLQQSEYTIGANFNNGEWVYTLHDEVFANNSTEQDLLWKFTLPISERAKTLKALDAHNLNEFSLFQTTETLLNTIAYRELEIKNRDI